MARNLNRFAAFVAVAALALIASAPAFAQATYPTPSGSRVNGVVPLTCDSTGANCGTDVRKATHTLAAAVNFLAAGDSLTICGSSTKTINIRRVVFSQSTNASAGFFLQLTAIKRSTANSGGTSAGVSVAALDSASPAPTATALSYSVAPTPGTAVGNVYTLGAIYQSTATVVANPVPLEMNFGGGDMQGVVLRGAAQCLAFQSTAAASLFVSAFWTEE